MVMRPGDDTASGLTPSQLKVAAALSRRPFGVRSACGVARLAGVGASTARRALSELSRREIVHRRVDEVAAGDVSQVAVWSIHWRSPAWHAVAATVGRVGLPAPAATPQPTARRVPGRLAHLFWNADLCRVDAQAHGPYLASRILRADDCQALGWLARHLHPEAIRSAAGGRGLDPRRVALAHLLAGA